VALSKVINRREHDMPRNRKPTLRADDLVRFACQVDDIVRELRGIVSWLVLEEHDRGATWDEIGTVFGVSRQAVHERFGSQQPSSSTR
jgi:hypothetical protein